MKFLEAQQVQKPFSIYTNWLVIQHVDEVMNFLSDQNGKAKMIIVSPAAANAVLKTGYDAAISRFRSTLIDDIALAKTELGFTDADIIPVCPRSSAGAVPTGPEVVEPGQFRERQRHVHCIGKTDTPAEVKTDIENKLNAIGVQVAWVDDSE